MAEAYNEHGSSKYKDSVEKGLEFIFEAQYETGGWPQYYPYGTTPLHPSSRGGAAAVPSLNASPVSA